MSNDKTKNTNTPNNLSEEPLTEALRARRQKELRLAKEAERDAQRSSKIDKWRKSRYWLPRATYHLLHSIWITAMAIGGFLAWLISLIFL